MKCKSTGTTLNTGKAKVLGFDLDMTLPIPGRTLTQPRSWYCVSFPNQPLSIQLFVIIIEKGVKDFTQLTVIPLAYASSSLCQGPRKNFSDL